MYLYVRKKYGNYSQQHTEQINRQASITVAIYRFTEVGLSIRRILCSLMIRESKVNSTGIRGRVPEIKYCRKVAGTVTRYRQQCRHQNYDVIVTRC